MILKSYAKLNLYLEVLGLRKDNYHNIKTVFERISLHDTIVLKPRQDKKIKIYSDSQKIPLDESNLAFKSANLLQRTFNINKGADIKIIKRIPVGSGMGGGSSNAACVLLGLNKLWRLGLGKKALAGLAARIGSDSPFFIYEVPFALGESRGERIKPLKSLFKAKIRHVLAVPKLAVSTPLIYKKWDKSRLTSPKSSVKMLLSAIRKNDLSSTGEALFNDLQPVTAKIYPEVLVTRRKFISLGLSATLMSGSGPTVFGIASSKKMAQFAYRNLKKSKELEVFAVETV